MSQPTEAPVPDLLESEPERARRTLWAGVVVFRAASLGWMVLANILASEPLRHAALAWSGIAVAGVWTGWIIRRGDRSDRMLSVDLALSSGLILLAGYVTTAHSARIFYATTYPASTALAWGAAKGRAAGLGAGAVLSAALVVSRPIQGIPLENLTSDQLIGLLNGSVYYVLAGGAAGVVTRTIDRSASEVRSVRDIALRDLDRSARLAERERIRRQIHDSVLQGLAEIERDGRARLATSDVGRADLSALLERVAEESQDLRTIVVREPEAPPPDSASLRSALEVARKQIKGLKVEVNAPGPIWLPGPLVATLTDAVSQALTNVVRHANATKAVVFADLDDGRLELSVRDDGRGFVYSEELLQVSGKVGMLVSMKGAIEDLGGRMRVHTAPGIGTEVEFRVPVPVTETAVARAT